MTTRLPLLLLACAILPHPPAQALQLFVAPDGLDSNPGTRARPFASLERARDELRLRKAAGDLGRHGAVVQVRGGTYCLAQSFALDERDSGAAGASISYRAYRGEPVRITGGRPLNAAAFAPVTDPAILERLPGESRSEVLQVDLGAEGITDFGEVRARGFARPYVNPGLELFINDKAMQLARWPNQGTVPLGKIADPGSTPRTGDTSGRGGTLTYDFDRPARWTQARGLMLSGLFCYGFADDTMPVKSIDTEAKTMTFAIPHIYGLASGRAFHAYFALNLLEEIDQPGEWFLDREKGLLYLWPPEGSPGDGSRIWVSTLDRPLVSLQEVSHVTFQGFTLEISRGMGVYIEGGTGNRVAGCTMRNLGTVGVCFGQGVKPNPHQMTWCLAAEEARPVPPAEFTSGELGEVWDYIYGNSVWNRNAGTNHSVVSCDIYDTGAGGVVLSGGDRKTLTPGGNVVANCDIHHFNRLDRTYRCGVMVDGVGNRIANNLIHNAPHGAVLLHGNDHVIEGNEIHHVCQNADDMGAFYMGRDPSEQGNVVQGNFFHHNGNRKGATCSVYLDDGSCGTLVQGNVFFKQVGPPIWINGGNDHVFDGNVFVECGGAGIAQGMDNSAWPGFVKDPLQVLRLRQDLDVTKPPYDRYPSLADVFAEGPDVWRGQTVTRNLSVMSGDLGGGRNRVQDNWVTDSDPGFWDAGAMNFGLKSNAEAYRRIPDLQPAPFEDIGLYRDRFRKALPVRAVEAETVRVRDPKVRGFACSFAEFEGGGIVDQGNWEGFGAGPDLKIVQGAPTAGFTPGRVAESEGIDSWACIRHGIILDGSRAIVLEADAYIPPGPPPNASFELYLNRNALHANPAFGLGLMGGAECGHGDDIAVRQDHCGPRAPAVERLPAGHWVRLRLTIPAGAQAASVTLQDLTAVETQPRVLRFVGETEAVRLAQADTWQPPLADLDTLILRLGGGAQVAAVSVTNQ